MRTKILSLVAIISIGLFSCQKSDDFNMNSLSEDAILKSTEISMTDLRVESIAQESGYEADFFSNSEQLLRQFAQGKGRIGKLLEWRLGLRYQMGQCPDVSINTAEEGYPITITLNYGESTELQNGRILSGIIIIEISGPRFSDGTTRTVNYTDFTVDSVAVEGTIIEQFIGDNISSRTVSVNGDLSFTLPDGTVIERVSQRVHEWLEGIETLLEHEDDVIEITGSVNTYISNGESYQKEIVEPLLRLGSCLYFVQGKTRIIMNGEVISELDFGDGECDNSATLTIGGETIEVDLHGKLPKANRAEKN